MNPRKRVALLVAVLLLIVVGITIAFLATKGRLSLRAEDGLGYTYKIPQAIVGTPSNAGPNKLVDLRVFSTQATPFSCPTTGGWVATGEADMPFYLEQQALSIVRNSDTLFPLDVGVHWNNEYMQNRRIVAGYDRTYIISTNVNGSTETKVATPYKVREKVRQLPPYNYANNTRFFGGYDQWDPESTWVGLLDPGKLFTKEQLKKIRPIRLCSRLTGGGGSGGI